MAIPRKSYNEPHGMTLVELLIAIAILGIICAIAVPGILGGIHRTGVDGASQRLTQDIRLAQSNAITKGVQTRLIVFDQSGVIPDPGIPPDTTKANKYRIEMRSGPLAPWPSVNDYPGANSNVLTVWEDLGTQYRGVSVTQGSAILFNSQGFLMNPLAPVNTVVQGPGGSKTVQTTAIGKVTVL
ncbi:MAG TPA: GspH/FimT family pseudopilin [Candidatus Methylomirabilis sp.]|nr:GspH/FimT family pseudopilin [Candidatus Methylomirabilis sp.]